MEQYTTVRNMQLCESVFARYMQDKFRIAVPDDGRVKRILFKIMQDVRNMPAPASGSPPTLRQLNDLTLNIARDAYLKSQKGPAEVQQRSDPPQPRQPQQLQRPQQLQQPHTRLDDGFGAPGMGSNEPKRAATDRMAQSLERLVNERQYDRPAPPPAAPLLEPVKVDKMDNDELARRMRDLERQREAAPPPDANVLIPRPDDAALLYRRPAAKDDEVGGTQAQAQSQAQSQAQAQSAAHEPREFVQAPPSARRALRRYVAVNSFDRNWLLDPFRYSYTVWFSGYSSADVQRRYKNIREIAVSRLVVPMDVTDRPTLNLSTLTMANANVNDYAFGHAYLMVCIDGIDDVYDGTNERIRRAFATMLLDRAYKAPNGRGYVVLKPAQDESKVFYPAPLSDLRSLRISIVKPNGAIVSNATDDYLISKIEYEDYNPTHLRVVLNKFFARNEFFVGDTIMFKDYSAATSVPGPDPGASTLLAAFVNRPEGHEITEIGEPNENGYYRTFHILAPGYIDKVAGRLVVDQRAIAALLRFNIEQQSRTDPELYESIRNGGVCNVSLQNTLALTIVQEVVDGPSMAADRILPPV